MELLYCETYGLEVPDAFLEISETGIPTACNRVSTRVKICLLDITTQISPRDDKLDLESDKKGQTICSLALLELCAVYFGDTEQNPGYDTTGSILQGYKSLLHTRNYEPDWA